MKVAQLFFADPRVALVGSYRQPLFAELSGNLTFANFASINGGLNGTLAGYALVLFVWLNYARHSACWVPYDNLLY